MSGLHTTTYEEMRDEAEFREYIGAVIGEDGADLLSDFAWKASEGGSTRYLTHLAEISKAIAVSGPEAVLQVLEEAKKPSGEHTEQIEFAMFAKKVAEEAATAIGQYPPEKKDAATAKQWKKVLRRVSKKLATMYPNATPEAIKKAIAVGCVWDKVEETFGIEPMKLVDAMRAPPG